MKNIVKPKTYPFLLIGLLMLALSMLIGCGSEEEKQNETQETQQTGAVQPQPDDVSLVDFTNEKGEIICPVMKTVISSKEEAFDKTEYNGKIYYFCCGGCPEDFKNNPEKYAQLKTTDDTPPPLDDHSHDHDDGHDH